MKATGIVRRIDDLGRVVIPKEIRRTMRIREGDPLEIYTNREGEVIFKKYSPIGELSTFASEYAETMAKICSLSVVITDRDAVIAVAGTNKKEYMDKRLSQALEEIISQRQFYRAVEGKTPVYVTSDEMGSPISCAMPIISAGDIIGCVVSLDNSKTGNKEHCEENLETKLIQTAATFLSRQHDN